MEAAGAEALQAEQALQVISLQGDSPFQQELRTHLLVIQRKVDLLSQKVDLALAEVPSRPFIPEAGLVDVSGRQFVERVGQVRVPSKPQVAHPSGDLTMVPTEASDGPRLAASSGLLDDMHHRPSMTTQHEPPPKMEDFSLPNTMDLEIVNLDQSAASVQVPQLEMPSEETPRGLREEGAKSGKASISPKGRGRVSIAAHSERRDSDTASDSVPVSQNDRRSRYTTGKRISHFLRRSSIISGDRLRLVNLSSWVSSRQSKKSYIMERIGAFGGAFGGGVPKLMKHTSQLAEERAGTIHENCLWQFVHAMPFQFTTAFMIVLNTILTGVAADHRLEAALNKNPEDAGWEHTELVFCIFFSFELLMRFSAERILFFMGPEWRWNLFDFVLVFFSLVDLVMNAVASVAISNVTAARIVRFVRLIRVIRIARAVRAFHSLRIVVFAIFESMLSLMWCLIVVGLIIYMFSILFLYGVTEHVTTLESISTAPTQEMLEYYGSVPLAMLSLFMTISGGVDWKDAMKPLVHIHWTYQPMFTFYIFLMVIGVLNVVMGAFVAATAAVADKDRDVIVKNEITAMQDYTMKVKAFFREADRDRSGLLSWEEFEAHLQVPSVQAYFRALELDVSQAHVLFKLLDRDGNNEVSLEEFLAGCLRLKGQAKSLEVNMLLYESKRLHAKVCELMDAVIVLSPELHASSGSALGKHVRNVRSQQHLRTPENQPPTLPLSPASASLA